MRMLRFALDRPVQGLEFLHSPLINSPAPSAPPAFSLGERVSRDGAFSSCRGTGEGLLREGLEPLLPTGSSLLYLPRARPNPTRSRTAAREGVKKSTSPVIPSAATNLHLFVFKGINSGRSLTTGKPQSFALRRPPKYTPRNPSL